MFLADGRGLPLAVDVCAGQRHESVFFEDVVDGAVLTRPHAVEVRKWPDALAADRALSVERIRGWLGERGVTDVIPYRTDQLERMDAEPPFDREAYRGRNAVERLVGWLKELRRLATRYEKLAIHFLALVKIAMIRLYLRRHFADTA